MKAVRRQNLEQNSQKGFTLAETLVTILILLMVASVVVAGIPAAVRAYEKIVLRANAEVLLSTSVASLRDNLATAGDITVENNAVTFYCGNDGVKRRIYRNDKDNGVIMLQEYIGYDPTAAIKFPSRQLVTDAASTRDLFVTYEGVSFEGQLVTFSGLSVYRKSEQGSGAGTASPLTTVETLNIRVLGVTTGKVNESGGN